VRYREDTPEELARARAAVAAWRDRNPTGTGEDLISAIGHQFHRDYGVVLGDGGFEVWQARLPEPDGEQIISRYALRELTGTSSMSCPRSTVASQIAARVNETVELSPVP
jgi:hypothetical protein